MSVKHSQRSVYQFPRAEVVPVEPDGVIDLRNTTMNTDPAHPMKVDPEAYKTRQMFLASRRALRGKVPGKDRNRSVESGMPEMKQEIIASRRVLQAAFDGLDEPVPQTATDDEPIFIPIRRVMAPGLTPRPHHRHEVTPTRRRRTALRIGAIALSVGLLVGGFLNSHRTTSDAPERTVAPAALIAEIPTSTTSIAIPGSGVDQAPQVEQTDQTSHLTAEQAVVLQSPEFHTMSETLSAHPEWSEQDVINVLDLAAHLEAS